MRYLNHLIILTLAGAALLVTMGCNFDLWAIAVGYEPDKVPKWVIIRCLPDSKTLQAYESPDQPIGGFFNVFDETQVDSPLNGKACSVSNENQNRPFSISEAVDKGFIAPPPNDVRKSLTGAAVTVTAETLAAAAPPPPSLVNTFPWLEPLMFGPAFPQADSNKVPDCPPTMEAYLVNHIQGTVTAFGFCPMQVFKEINVPPLPLQVAVTPDGSQALVTSYSGALTFIDTATNTVRGTLDLGNYNPSGIAISPDSTRAYVTHYLDSLPALLVIDVPNRKLLSTIALPQPYPRVVVLTPDGSQAWINYYSNRIVTIVDLTSGTVAASINTSQPVSTGMAFNPQGTKAFLAVYPNQVYVVDTATLETQVKLTVGNSPSDVVASPDGRRIFVTSESEPGMWWIDPRNNTLIGHSVPTGQTTGGSQGLLVFH